MNPLTTLAGLAAMIGLSQAAVFDFTVTLSGDQQVPANTSTRTGTGTATYDSATRLLTVSGTLYDSSGSGGVDGFGGGAGGIGGGNGLVGLARLFTSAHVHRGALGVTGDVVFEIPFGPAGGGPFAGSGVIGEADETALFSSGLYIDFHSLVYLDGEIRGQFVAVPELEAFATVVGFGLIGVGLWRRRAIRG